MKNLFILLRDFSYLYNWRARGSENLAENNYKFTLGGILAPYYVTIFSVVAVVQGKLGINLFPATKNTLVSFIYGMILFAPYFLFLYVLFNYLSHFPLPNELEDYYKRTKVISLIVLTSGFLIMGLFPYLLSFLSL